MTRPIQFFFRSMTKVLHGSAGLPCRRSHGTPHRARHDRSAPCHAHVACRRDATMLATLQVVGTSMGLAMGADLAIATDDTKFSMAYARIGKVPIAAAASTLPVGWTATLERDCIHCSATQSTRRLRPRQSGGSASSGKHLRSRRAPTILRRALQRCSGAARPGSPAIASAKTQW